MLGKKVTWSSMSGGVSKEKSGTVAQVLQPRERPDKARFPDLYQGVGCGIGRNEVSYVVAVQTGVRAVRHYWPRTAHVKVVE